MTFHFPDADTLRLALTGGLVPPTVSLAPAAAEFLPGGGVRVVPSVAAPKNLAAQLKKFGVESGRGELADPVHVSCWLQLLPVVRDPKPPQVSSQAPVLFELNDPEQLPVLAGEMLRLGNDRQSYRWLADDAGDAVLLRVIGPPYYSLLRAIDAGPDKPVRAYLERGPRVWVEVGHTHPLVEQVRPPEKQLLLMRPGRDWAFYDDVPFRDVYEILDFKLPAGRVDHADAGPADKLEVPLRLAPGSSADDPELWVLPGDDADVIDRLVRELNERTVARLAFAVGTGENGRSVIALRVRPSRLPPPQLAVEGLRCRSYLKLPNLFVPCGSRLQPPLRRDAVRKLLADDPARITWLVPDGGDGQFRPESLPDGAFRPLSDWVDYVLDRDRAALAAWVESAHFDFADFVCKDEAGDKPEKGKPASGRRRGPAGGDDDAPPPPPAKGKASAAPAAFAPAAEEPAAAAPVEPSVAQKRLAALEQQFVEFDGPLDAPERRAAWPELAALNTMLKHPDDASVCWANAIWSVPAAPPAWADGWAAAEFGKGSVTDADLDGLLAEASPSPAQARRVAAFAVRAAAKSPVPAGVARRLPAVQQFLERHDGQLGVRAAWLSAVALARLAGGDTLGLARARERLLARLHAGGLTPERDLPTFLRFAGQRDSARLRRVRDKAGTLRDLARAWAGPDGGENTLAYVDLLFAFGLSRLGEASAGRELADAAVAKLRALEKAFDAPKDPKDDRRGAHLLLADLFAYRINQLLSGTGAAGPPPAELSARQAKLPRNAAYMVERFLASSAVLDARGQADPYRNFKLQQDELLKELMALGDVHDPKALADRTAKLLKGGPRGKLTPLERVLVLADTMPLATRAGEAFTAALLDQVAAALEAAPPKGDPAAAEKRFDPQEKRFDLLRWSVFQAGHYGRTAQVQQFVGLFGKLLAASDKPPMKYIPALVGQSLRSLRRLGLAAETQKLLEQLDEAVAGGKAMAAARAAGGAAWSEAAQTWLHLAGGWFHAGRPEKATPALDEGRRLLYPGEPGAPASRPLPADYAKTAEAYASALGQAPPEVALPKLEEMFKRLDKLPNTMTTNSHFSKLHLNVVEAVVLAVASDELALGPSARKWLDEDEYLVRRRVHADMDALRSGTGW